MRKITYKSKKAYLKIFFTNFFFIFCLFPIFLNAQSYLSQFFSSFSLISVQVKASFSYSPIIIVSGMPVRFIDTSKGSPESWLWEFGDGSMSYEKSPVHSYKSPGVYSVSLRISKNGSSNKATRKIKVYPIRSSTNTNKSDNQTLTASFTYSPSSVYIGQTVQFTDNSSGNPTSWAWKFGDGETSTQKNPTHIYSSAGSYNVTLTVSNSRGSNSMTQTITVNSSLVANFNYSPAYPTVGQEVQFIDSSQGSPTSWAWDFGDGRTSTLKNPTHAYSQVGTFNVKLTISDENNSSIISRSLSISASSHKTIIAASCFLEDIEAAIAEANPGDTVIVPNGSATWSRQLVIGKGIILKAATKGGVIIKAGFEGTNWGYDNYLIRYVVTNPAANEPFRFSGFKLDLAHKTDGIVLINDDYRYKVNKIRIDNNEFFNGQVDVSARLIGTYGAIYGVVDNNIFHNDDVTNAWRFISTSETANGRYAWQYYTFDFGTADNLYIEDNEFYTTNGLVVLSGAGGRYSFRHNYIKVMVPGTDTMFLCDGHGNMAQNQGNWSQMGFEMYGNTIDANGHKICMTDWRGGKCLVYGNTIVNAASDFYYKVREEFYDSENPPAKNLISGQPQYPSEGYIFGDTVNGRQGFLPNVVILQTLDYGAEGIIPREDFNFFREKSGFGGTSGVGMGVLSQRPSYCLKEGVAWWAIDENKLYRWHSGKWELYYTPYTYPHPLRTILND